MSDSYNERNGSDEGLYRSEDDKEERQVWQDCAEIKFFSRHLQRSVCMKSIFMYTLDILKENWIKYYLDIDDYCANNAKGNLKEKYFLKVKVIIEAL